MERTFLAIKPDAVQRGLVGRIINRIEDMHKKGFLHRDLKANNFMVGKGNKRNIVYIIDFGLAKRYKDLKNNRKTTNIRDRGC